VRLRWLSASVDPLGRPRAVEDFEAFPAEREATLLRAVRGRSGRIRENDALSVPPYHHIRICTIGCDALLDDDDVRERGAIYGIEHERDDGIPDAYSL
jgi:hypothetical protein